MASIQKRISDYQFERRLRKTAKLLKDVRKRNEEMEKKTKKFLEKQAKKYPSVKRLRA